MTHSNEVQANRLANSGVEWNDDTATSWFVPPIVVPAFLLALMAAYVGYQIYS
jgi:hypothetical protein